MTGHLQNLTSDSVDLTSHASCRQNYSLAFYSGLFAFGGWYDIIDTIDNLDTSKAISLITQKHMNNISELSITKVIFTAQVTRVTAIELAHYILVTLD